MEETRKSGRPRKGWIDDVEENLKITGIRNWHAVARDRKEWKGIVVEAKVHNGLQSLRRSRRRRKRRTRRRGRRITSCSRVLIKKVRTRY
jgi:hypothetical protein